MLAGPLVERVVRQLSQIGDGVAGNCVEQINLLTLSKRGVAVKGGPEDIKKCIFAFFAITLFYFWYQIVALFKSFLMVCLVRA